MPSNLAPALCTGRISHKRFHPVVHEFHYSVWMLWSDIDKLNEIPGQGLPMSLTVSDLDEHSNPRARVERAVIRSGLRMPRGPIYVLAQPRSFGFFFNPVVFFCCFEVDVPAVVVAEIHNTPWNERHSYVFGPEEKEGDQFIVHFPKSFHVSPFASMKVDYEWYFDFNSDRVQIDMRLKEEGLETLRASLLLDKQAPDIKVLRRMAWHHPFQNQKTLIRIYLNALRLWRKGSTFHPHPKTRS